MDAESKGNFWWGKNFCKVLNDLPTDNLLIARQEKHIKKNWTRPWQHDRNSHYLWKTEALHVPRASRYDAPRQKHHHLHSIWLRLPNLNLIKSRINTKWGTFYMSLPYLKTCSLPIVLRIKFKVLELVGRTLHNWQLQPSNATAHTPLRSQLSCAFSLKPMFFLFPRTTH